MEEKPKTFLYNSDIPPFDKIEYLQSVMTVASMHTITPVSLGSHKLQAHFDNLFEDKNIISLLRCESVDHTEQFKIQIRRKTYKKS